MNVEQLKKAISEVFEKAAEEAAEKILEECPRKELKEEPEPWEPKAGDEYYHYDPGVGVGVTTWTNDGFDQAVNKIGNVFRTEDEAEKTVKWLKARKVLFDDTKGFKPNWPDDQEYKWSVVWDWCGRRLFADFYFCETSSPGPYFATKEDAKASIEAHEKEWKIYLLGGDSND